MPVTSSSVFFGTFDWFHPQCAPFASQNPTAATKIAAARRRRFCLTRSSVQIAHQRLRRLRRGEFQRSLVADRNPVAGPEPLAVELQLTFGHLHPRMASGLELVFRGVATGKAREED